MREVLRKLRPYYIQKAFRYLLHFGPKEFFIRVSERLQPDEVPYGPWREKQLRTETELSEQRRQAPELYRQLLQAERQPDREPELHAASQPEHQPDSQAMSGPERKAMSQGNSDTDGLGSTPFFSVLVPAYHTDPACLREMADSVLAQTFPYLELVIANSTPEDREMSAVLDELQKSDPRVKVLILPENLGIAGNTNEALEAAKGTFVCLLDHDDLIEADALYEAARLLAGKPEISVIYTDEDKVRTEGGKREYFQPDIKPGFNLDLLRSNNYITHFLMVRRSLALELHGWSKDYDGAQDYDFILRCADTLWKRGAGAGPENSGFARIPRVLYHWRVSSASTADNPMSKLYAYEAGKRAIEAHLQRRGTAGDVSLLPDYGFYRVRYPLLKEDGKEPLVSIVIPNRESRDTLEVCLESIRKNTDYPNYEIIVVENNSSSGQILNYYKQIQGKNRTRVIRRKGAFNFSAVMNAGIREANGDYIAAMNNDVTISDPGWLRELLSVAQRPEAAAVGPKLFYPDGTVQSAGIAVGIGSVAGSLFTDLPGSRSGYLHKAGLLQDLSAVTAALVLLKKSALEEVGLFTEDLPVAFNDVDLCLKLRERGYLVVFDPFATAVHHESRTRGDEYTKDKAEVFRAAEDYMHKRWKKYYDAGDPYYSPNFSHTKWNYSMNEKLL